ncbi:hypothetical protein A3K34_00150 [candidate division WWE3 bacterium RIFOXYC1_FULL_40_10]|uniref:Methyltransferase type 11 domain-containing protein n=1 Tax=candidate division WWE3 bacterium RIFOXYA2_FULL_46_9 TaxID=1802636 RepID=A0A1F4W1C5_UNCKA|nr:MAG: hypothetical protein A3K58_00150 [candidate division WWE3 bacterium RIFOXYB1_FULL_40_22]OGC61304.1 MAG: hypothetical protein A3K37_00150 [candidate division WWE3 bacterium RIFOXYA1_FULL_40_11]OGC63214.1 MAG: hypothetical protein A2264_00805 [candidate division WWE3 bacterium RIFOXYA2_FULL_46_9]OGC65295.1 MAG: hypothetical protein A2326_04435 [candidate division WWE3 bacterium RIFOXYB2_FULL_41_6]OGC65687.1 MAG: hypothetical protein A3K34_00150 [candidate division WWE3 bacterium RIFOXYC1_
MRNNQSKLQHNPKSLILEKGYINIYSELNSKEKLQIQKKIIHKQKHPEWEETMVFITNKFAELVPQDSVVLDAGCGNGNYVIDENRERIKWAVGVDVMQESVVKNICLDEIKITNLETLPFENSSFDAVVSLWVFEHLERPQKVVSEIHRVLKPGGYFFMCTPNKSFLPIAVLRILKSRGVNYFLNKMLFGREEKDVFETYYRANTLSDIKKLVNDGFTLETLKLNYDPSYFIPNIGAAPTLPHILGIWRCHKPLAGEV